MRWNRHPAVGKGLAKAPLQKLVLWLQHTPYKRSQGFATSSSGERHGLADPGESHRLAGA